MNLRILQLEEKGYTFQDLETNKIFTIGKLSIKCYETKNVQAFLNSEENPILKKIVEEVKVFKEKHKK